jgi:hypothetical protein
MGLSVILETLEGRKLKVKTQHMLIVRKVLTASIANLEIQVYVVVTSYH